MVTPYQKERCIAYIVKKRPDVSYAKVCRIIGRSRSSEDVLDANLFFSLQSVKDPTNLWISDYNNKRPHEALNFKTPAEYEAS